ncbi:MAG: 4a-hydroxytetrahydrobiopterin dehydratase [Ignavibacteriales bacterium CG12_big_fil_rev_8_21_14_0_65_30_8]|nr:MAG: 4a-hydroxytetrahydrobiopterin dehydratase [Ignavibacteriales bacterium CG12_big_fil_rev_8_21_14_0_65_30_8]
MSLLTEQEIKSNLSNLSEWQYENKSITKEFVLKDFNEVLYFVNKIGRSAEAINHHPDLLMHSWNKLKITISTHDKDGVTEKDFELANKIEELK